MGVKFQLLARFSFLAILFAQISHGLSRRVKQPKGAVVQGICGSAIACSQLDQSWPNKKDFTCGSSRVSSTAFITATQAMTVSPEKAKNMTTWPTSAHETCGNLEPSHTKHSFNNGRFTVHFTIKGICNCKAPTSSEPEVPNCQAATSQNTLACNIAMFQFCALEKDGVSCT